MGQIHTRTLPYICQLTYPKHGALCMDGILDSSARVPNFRYSNNVILYIRRIIITTNVPSGGHFYTRAWGPLTRHTHIYIDRKHLTCDCSRIRRRFKFIFHYKHNIHSNESFLVNWEYIKQTINPRMKWKPLESCRVQVKKHLIFRRKLQSDVLPKIDHLRW